MTDQQALAIVRERRGTMYDPAVVDVFLKDYLRIMPAYDPTPHPASRAIGDARAQDRTPVDVETPLAVDAGVADSLLAVTSLSRAVGGNAGPGDVGALLWTILKQVLPCEALAIFVPDTHHDQVAVRYAIGQDAARLRTLRCATGAGIAGWVAVTLRPAINADPMIDGGPREERTAALRSCLAVPIVESASLVAVLALYRADTDAFTDDHVRLLELLGARLSAPLATALAAEPLATHPTTLTLIRGGIRL
jgi:transcriptional regulator with GAF, ATPase, and Fis domain